MEILKLKPTCKDYLWGGHRLVEEYGIDYPGDICAEAWVLSCHPDGPCYVENGADQGCTLAEYVEKHGKAILGTKAENMEYFPLLTKLIDARDNLSVQVHPSDDYALSREGQYGKTEMWYVLDAEPGAVLYQGFKEEITKEEFEERIKNNTLTEVVNPVQVKKGDVIFIAPGTLHAIGKGILIAEVQQNSNLTYRVYDYGRVGADGKPRQLHIEKALEVTKLEKPGSIPTEGGHMVSCKYFTVDTYKLTGEVKTLNADETSFQHILVLEGTGSIRHGETTMEMKKGDSFFIPAGLGDYTVSGKCEILLSRV